MCAVNRCTPSIATQKIEVPERTCVDCKTLGCAHNNGRYPSFCLTSQTTADDVSSLRGSYEGDEDTYAFMKAAAITTSRGFSEQMCRVEETMDYCHRMGYRKIGIAFCAGVAEEARIFTKILRIHGYEVVGYTCKVGALSNADMGLEESCCNFGSVACNPLMQVERLNAAKTDLNVVMGLCVGHDAYFYRLSDAPCTTLLAKDKAMCNNTGSALYASQTASLWSRMMTCDPTLAAPGFVSDEALAQWQEQKSKGCCG
ncbi:MAG: DUF1847 domain-containing protein [Coriobacteriia bacterium]|nr:DUF1847 domain-containing protein [Coriobacteriia bacterium]